MKDNNKQQRKENDMKTLRNCMFAFNSYSYSFMTIGKQLCDGTKVDISLNGVDGKTIVTLPIVLWTQETITKSMLSAGFSQIEWIEETYSETIETGLKEWAIEASKDLGLQGYFRANK